MMSICQELIELWGCGTVILSPRDLKQNQLRCFSGKIQKLNGKVLLDPQFYIPRADYHRLISHEYWPRDYDTSAFDGDRCIEMMESLAALNNLLKTDLFIVPGNRAAQVDTRWRDSQSQLLQSAMMTTPQDKLMTICLSSDAIRSRQQIDDLMVDVPKWSVAGFYLIVENPKNSYLSNDPLWLSNLLNLVAGLRRLDKSVIIGYCNHQHLIVAIAAANAIASGTYLNVRSFNHQKFKKEYGEDFVPRKGGPVWYYYCPQALSEYALPFLDLAVTAGLKPLLLPDPPTLYAQPLFSVPQPSSAGWGQSASFKHYLSALHSQANRITEATFDDTVSSYGHLLDEAESVLESLRHRGIRARARSFWDVLDTNRAAMASLMSSQGPVLSREWTELV
jgi:hypothetical protein